MRSLCNPGHAQVQPGASVLAGGYRNSIAAVLQFLLRVWRQPEELELLGETEQRWLISALRRKDRTAPVAEENCICTQGS